MIWPPCSFLFVNLQSAKEDPEVLLNELLKKNDERAVSQQQNVSEFNALKYTKMMSGDAQQTLMVFCVGGEKKKKNTSSSSYYLFDYFFYIKFFLNFIFIFSLCRERSLSRRRMQSH